MKTTPRATVLAAVALLALSVTSLFVGVSEVGLYAALTDGTRDHLVLVVSRGPRLASLILAGAAMSVAGLIMQHLSRNRFVAPSTAGTVDAAGLGVLVATFFFGSSSLMGKILISVASSLAATLLFLGLVRSVRFKDTIFVPLVGLMFGGVLRAIAEVFAYRTNLLQTLSVWLNGDFSGILRGRYETLYLAAGVAAIAYVFADRLTLVGMGESFARNLGVSYRTMLNLGLAIVALVTSVVVVTVGSIPFLGLIVPNVVTLVTGDNLRRSLPITALVGAIFVLVGDLVGRMVIFPYEIPIGTVLGVGGSLVFLWMLLRKNRHALI